jgi:asparagine synthetase B (glutamine-hydrolysing)
MCGIIFSTVNIGNSFDLIKYRCPDNTSIIKTIGKTELYFGHHRLNIIENQPIIKNKYYLESQIFYNHRCYIRTKDFCHDIFFV